MKNPPSTLPGKSQIFVVVLNAVLLLLLEAVTTTSSLYKFLKIVRHNSCLTSLI